MEPTTYECERALYSRRRLQELQAAVAQCPSIDALDGISVFVAGSYGRHEASSYSDIDPFFIRSSAPCEPTDAAQEAFFDELKTAVEHLSFPPLTDGGIYLQVHELNEIKEKMGGREDDWKNLFTARMLLLLEGRPIYNEQQYKDVLRRIIEEYFRDYGGHEANFAPLFLLNDIHRYWKTLLINYEHSRNSEPSRTRRDHARVKNFKLRYSRLTTCFATIAAVTSLPSVLSPDNVLEIVQLTPRERLRFTARNVPGADDTVAEMAARYDAFLELTALPTEELHAYFSDDVNKATQGKLSKEYGDLMYWLLTIVGKAAADRNGYNLLRFLVI